MCLEHNFVSDFNIEKYLRNSKRFGAMFYCYLVISVYIPANVVQSIIFL